MCREGSQERPNWRKLQPTAGVIGAVVIAVIVSISAGKWYLGELNDDYCRLRGVDMMPVVRMLESYRKAHGEYPVVSDVNALKGALNPSRPSDQRVLALADLLYDGDGAHYSLAVFPDGHERAGEWCGCFIVHDGTIVGFPQSLSAKRRAQLARQLGSFIATKSPS